MVRIAVMLRSSHGQVLDFAGFWIRWRMGGWAHCCAELGDQPGIDGIGFRQLADGAGVAANLQWRDHHHR
ncbi:MAG TPA: hypothetical protein VE553_03735 [Candidatus Binatia bacterium]|jgi:hypothetical protein|nr:hypothetical protein [Candidatus Binatia bacterium]